MTFLNFLSNDILIIIIIIIKSIKRTRMVSFISGSDLGNNADYKAYDSCADLICKYSNPKVLHAHMVLCQ